MPLVIPYGAVVLAKLAALKVGAILATMKIAGVTYQVVYVGCRIIGTVTQYSFVAMAGAMTIWGAVRITKDCFVLGSKIFGRSVDNDDMKEFAWNVFQTAINSGVAVGEAGLVLCMAPATIGGITVLAVSALATYSAVTAPVDVAPRGNAAFFSGLGSGFDDHRNIRGEFPSGVPVFTGYHPVPHEDFSPIEVEEKIVTGIHARKAAFNGTKPSECYKEAYVKCVNF